MIAEIQCLPKPSGDADAPYAVVKAAISEIERSGLRYEVGALGTTVEGEPDEIWALLRRVHEACFDAGATSVVSAIKVAQWAGGEGEQRSMDTLTGDYR